MNNQRRPERWVTLQLVLEGRLLYRDRDAQQDVLPGWALMFAHGEASCYGVPASFREPLLSA